MKAFIDALVSDESNSMISVPNRVVERSSRTHVHCN